VGGILLPPFAQSDGLPKSEGVTALEAYDLTTRGGGGDFARLIAACEQFGPYCLIGGLAVNCYVEPVYTLDADLVVYTANLTPLSDHLRESGFEIEHHPHSVNATSPGSDLRIQFTTDTRYQDFLPRSTTATVLGVEVRIACLEDVTQDKLWAYSDPHRRLSKRKKDELDLIRLGERYPQLVRPYPEVLRRQLEAG